MDPHAGLTGHLQEQSLKEINYSLATNIGGSFSIPGGKGEMGGGGGEETKIRNKFAD
jgi:hypothetical protein